MGTGWAQSVWLSPACWRVERGQPARGRVTRLAKLLGYRRGEWQLLWPMPTSPLPHTHAEGQDRRGQGRGSALPS